MSTGMPLTPSETARPHHPMFSARQRRNRLSLVAAVARLKLAYGRRRAPRRAARCSRRSLTPHCDHTCGGRVGCDVTTTANRRRCAARAHRDGKRARASAAAIRASPRSLRSRTRRCRCRRCARRGHVHHAAIHRRATRRQRASHMAGCSRASLARAREYLARRASRALARRRRAPTATTAGAVGRIHHAAIHRRATRSDVIRTHLAMPQPTPLGRRVVALPAQVATPGRASWNSVRSVTGVCSYGVPVAVAPRRCAGPCRCHALPRPSLFLGGSAQRQLSFVEALLRDSLAPLPLCSETA